MSRTGKARWNRGRATSSPIPVSLGTQSHAGLAMIGAPNLAATKAELAMNAITLDRELWASAGERGLHEAIMLRRAIHAEPELGLDLPKTTAKVKAALAGLPLEIR